MASPKILGADEPAGNLDKASDESIVALFKRLAAEEGLAILLTHCNARTWLSQGKERSQRCGPLRGWYRLSAEMREFLRKTVIAGVGCFALLQIIPLYHRTNPQAPVASGISNQLEIPPEMDAILQRSCWNCHSNDTRWPWYSHVAPVSWMIVRDVNKARGIMNFSSWTEKMGEKLQLAVGMLSASCSDVTVGRMPKPEYVFLHSEAMLSEANKRDFCAWTQREGGRLLVLKRKNRQNGAAH